MTRTLVLSAVAAVLLCGTTGAEEKSSLGRILEFQKRLNEKIDYELPVQTTVDRALVELLVVQDIPNMVNEAAFVHAMQDKDVVKKAEVGPISKMTQVTRGNVLKMIIQNVPAADDNGVATYILRPDQIEITTRGAVRDEFYPGRQNSVLQLPPLAYGGFKKTPLAEALTELARTTGYSIVLDPKAGEGAGAAVTAEFLGVPADTAVQLLADEAGLRVLRLEGVYYVTSPRKARHMREDMDKRRREKIKAVNEQGYDDPLSPPLIP